MKRTLRYTVYPEDGAFVAQCQDGEVASDGNNEAEAADNLREALELYFGAPVDLVMSKALRSHV